MRLITMPAAIVTVLLASFLTLRASHAAAQDLQRQVYGLGGVGVFGGARAVDLAGGGGHFIQPRGLGFGVEVMGMWPVSPPVSQTPKDKIALFSFYVSGQRMNPDKRVQPFAFAGAFAVQPAQTDLSIGPFAGAGVNFWMTPRVGLRVELRLTLPRALLSEGGALPMTGVVWRFPG